MNFAGVMTGIGYGRARELHGVSSAHGFLSQLCIMKDEL